jgi:hypothetical protein
MPAEPGHRSRTVAPVLRGARQRAVPASVLGACPQRLDARALHPGRAVCPRQDRPSRDGLCPTAVSFVRGLAGSLRVALRAHGGRAGRAPPAGCVRRRRALRAMLRPEHGQRADGGVRAGVPLRRCGRDRAASAHLVSVHGTSSARSQHHPTVSVRGDALHACGEGPHGPTGDAGVVSGRVLRARALHPYGQPLRAAALHGLRGLGGSLHLAVRADGGRTGRPSLSGRVRRQRALRALLRPAEWQHAHGGLCAASRVRGWWLPAATAAVAVSAHGSRRARPHPPSALSVCGIPLHAGREGADGPAGDAGGVPGRILCARRVCSYGQPLPGAELSPLRGDGRGTLPLPMHPDGGLPGCDVVAGHLRSQPALCPVLRPAHGSQHLCMQSDLRPRPAGTTVSFSVVLWGAGTLCPCHGGT